MNRARSVSAPINNNHDARDFAIVTSVFVALYATVYYGLTAVVALGWHA